MTNSGKHQHRAVLKRVAHQAMLEKGLAPDFSKPALAQLEKITGPAPCTEPSMRDLRSRIWCSLDNDDSRDLDQLTVAEVLPDGATTVWVAIADVDAIVKRATPLDDHAQQNTTSVYTVAELFPMLPTKLSTNFTSLNEDEDRLAMVVEMTFTEDGSLRSSDLYPAIVRNHAKLAYNNVALWLNGSEPIQSAIIPGLEENLRLQDHMAQKLKALRHLQGALDLETIHARPIFIGDELKDLESEKQNRAKEIIEEFMIATNGVTARFLATKNQVSLRRVVRIPKRWDQI
ncbi:MAG: ribonuclease catalytic domain-containing protein, partial [Holophaga sp.]|nr:ribonuclease catalytic domain-containing protein [Holophaga sp.]